MIPSPTDAKTVALYFLDQTTDGRNTPPVIAKTINQAKNLLAVGYTKEEIIATIDFTIKRGVKMYSFGYLSSAIADSLREINKHKVDERVSNVKKELEEFSKQAMKEVAVDEHESTERNRQKAERLSVQSRVGTKYNLNMFEGHGQDN